MSPPRAAATSDDIPDHPFLRNYRDLAARPGSAMGRLAAALEHELRGAAQPEFGDD